VKKILIIEDEKNIVISLKMFFEHSGFEVFTSGNGLDGVSLAKHAFPDIILLDLVLPKIDGFEVCKILKNDEKTKNIPIIIISARTSKDEVDKAISLGAKNFIAKPFSINQIKKIIIEYLGES
jgi:two-component system, OmpR family, alkaline phosphatase synthesis response regulator PhoP